MDDHLLISEYQRNGSQAAFEELTRRYHPALYRAALLQVGDADLARDVVQNVFLALSRKAVQLSKLRTVAGWLFRATRFEALRVRRAHSRRARHDAAIAEFAKDVSSIAPDAGGSKLLVQESLSALPRIERELLVERFFDNKPLKTIATARAISVDAAQKRVERALAKVAALLRKRGCHLSHATLAAAFSSEAGGSALAAWSATTPACALTICKFMAYTKLKIVAATCVVAAVVAPLALERTPSGATRSGSKTVPSPGEETPAVAEGNQATERVTALEREVAALRTQLRNSAKAAIEPSVIHEGAASDIAKLKRRTIDPRNAVEDRLAALQELRALNARDGDVAVAMTQLIPTVSDPGVRADIFRQLNGVAHPALKGPLLEAIARDDSADVREEAAETLRGFRDDPEVRRALEAASRNDPSFDVRNQAVEALIRDESIDRLMQVLNDPASPDLHRYHATTSVRKLQGATADQAKTLLTLLTTTKAAKMREEIVEDLARHYRTAPGVFEWMRYLVENDPNSAVQEEAAKFLDVGGQ